MAKSSKSASTVTAEKVAIMAGSGLETRAIAKAIGQQPRNTRALIAKAQTDPELKALHDAARARIRSQALDILDRKMVVVDESWNSSTDLKSQAQMAKALADMAFPRWGEAGGPGMGAPQVQINMADPAVLVAMAEALRRWGTQVDVTPRRGNDE